MKVTLKTIVLAIPALSKLAAEDIRLQLAYRLKKNIAELQREADFFGEQRIKILEKYGTADESGNYTFEGDNEQKAIAELLRECPYSIVCCGCKQGCWPSN